MAKTTTAKAIMHSARITLNDAGSVRWTLPELLIYINDGMREIALNKPNAVSETVEHPLSEGTYQEHDYLALIRVTRNLATLAASPQGRTGGSTVTPIERTVLDLSMPGWQDPTVYPNQKRVDHICQDMADPQSFYVVPGNDGTGVIEVLVAKLPVDIPEPAAGQTNLDSYGAIVPLDDIYRTILLNYVLYRAYQKDAAEPGNAQRSQMYYQMFAAAVGIKTQTEAAANTDTTGKT